MTTKKRSSKSESKLTEEQKAQIIELRKERMSSREIALRVLGRSSRKSTVNDFLLREEDALASHITEEKYGPRVLLIDIETSPEHGMFFGRFKTNISEDMVIQHSKVLGFAYKWLDENIVHSVYPESFPAYLGDSSEEERVVREAHRVLSEAHIIVAHNGDKFDIPVLNARMAFYGMSKPKPSKTIDTWKIAKKEFRFPSNKLDVIGNYFGIGRKVPHSGFSLWRGCMEGDKESWEMMKTYNVGDVVLLEEVYLKLVPWSPRIPNFSLNYPNAVPRCPCCGGVHLNKHSDFAFTPVSVFDLYQCDDCGSWARGRKNVKTKEQRDNIYTTVR